MDRKRYIIVSSVLGFSAFFWWIATTLNLPEQPIVTGNTVTPDYIIDGLHLVRMSKNGNKKFSLSAKRLTHYSEENLARLDKVTLVQYQRDGITIHTSADSARYPDSGREVYMQKNVRIVHKKNNKVLSDIRSGSTHVILQ